MHFKIEQFLFILHHYFSESDTAKSVSPILSSYMIPEVQVGATTPEVRNSLATPYFTRAVPNDEVFYSAVASILQSLGWKYVQVRGFVVNNSEACCGREIRNSNLGSLNLD